MQQQDQRIFRPRSGYLDIVDDLASAIAAGRIKDGDQLPTQRKLARELGIAVATVSHAYSEARRRGLVVGKIGKGTYATGLHTIAKGLQLAEASSDVIDLSISRPPTEAAAPYLGRALQTLSTWPQRAGLLGTESANGSLRHRTIVSKWIAKRGIDIAPNQIIACSGVQHALSVILSAFARPGDIIATEELNFPGIKLLADIHGISLVGVPVDEDGLRVDLLEKLCLNRDVRFVLCSPTAHNPTTATLSVERRRQLAKMADEFDFLIIENDILGLMPKNRLPSLFSLQERKTFYVTGTSKVLATGLRLGFISAPTSFLHPLTGGVRGTIWMPPPLMLALFSLWVECGEDDRILRWHREEISARLAIVDSILGLDHVNYDSSSYHVWMSLPQQFDGGDFTDQAFEHGVIISPSETFTLAPNQDVPHAVRISLGFPNDRPKLCKGLQRIAQLLKMN